MTIFRKVFDSKTSSDVPEYFERVATPDDVDAGQPPAPSSQPLASETSVSEPLISEGPVSSPLTSHPVVSHQVASQPTSAQPAVSQPARSPAQAGPTHVSGPIFGIGHTEDVPPQPPAETAQNPNAAPGQDYAAMAAEAFGRMQLPAQPTTSHPAAQAGPSSVPQMMGAPDQQPHAQPHAPQPGAARTRLLGFHRSQPIAPDPMDDVDPQKVHAETLFPAGWVAITDGPGEGNALPIFGRVCVIGRGEDQDIRLDFGDTSISRSKHAAIAFDDEQRKFYLGHGGKSNLIRLNGRPVLSTEDLSHGDTIRIGETTLRFVALCGEEFTWNGPNNDNT